MRRYLILASTMLMACSGTFSDAITIPNDAGLGSDAQASPGTTPPQSETGAPDAPVAPLDPGVTPTIPPCAAEPIEGLSVVACKLGLDVVPLGVTEDSVLLLSGKSTYSLLRVDKATGVVTKVFASTIAQGNNIQDQRSVQFANGKTYWNEGERGEGWYAPGVSEVDASGNLRLVFSDLARLFTVDESAVYAKQGSLNPDGYIYRTLLTGSVARPTRLGQMSDAFLGARAGYLYSVENSSLFPSKSFVQVQRMPTTGGGRTTHLDPIRLSHATFSSQATLDTDGAIYYAIDYGGDTESGQCGIDTANFSPACVKRIDPAKPGQAETVLRIPQRTPYEALPTAVRVHTGRVFLRSSADLRWGKLGGTVGDTGMTIQGENISAPVFFGNTGYVTYRRGGGEVPLETILVSFSIE